jgi:hypothetical protein
MYPVLYPAFLACSATQLLTPRPSALSNRRVRDDATKAGGEPRGRAARLMLRINQVTPARKFLISAGLLLIVTGSAKLISVLGSAHILDMLDPVLEIRFLALFLGVGLLELLIGLECLRPGSAVWRAGLVAWLATSFVIYRLGLIWVGYHGACPCAGTLTGALHISPHAADTILKLVLGCLLVGSYTCLHFAWKDVPRATGGAGSKTANVALGTNTAETTL